MAASNKKIFAFIGCGCLAAAVGVVVLIGVVVFGVFGVIKQSDAYLQSLERVKTHPDALAALGEAAEIEAGWVVAGSVKLENDGGSANLSYSVSGPKGSGKVHVEGTRRSGVWRYDRMDLAVDNGGPTIDLRSSP